MATYGQTWWGQKWLETFNDIDCDNRLPRGRSYASSGRAKDLNVQGCTITAKVQGSRPSPYKVQIALEPFSPAISLQVRSLITSSPTILSSLLAKKLAPQLLERLQEQKIPLFPSSWRSIKASCSCPDFAMPCKHIAAVIYLLSGQIDKNPFLLFALRGFNLLAVVQEFSHGSYTQTQKIPELSALPTIPLKTFEDVDPYFLPLEALSSIDLSVIPDLYSCLQTVLADNPPFDHKNFHTILGTLYKHWQSYPHGPKNRQSLKALYFPPAPKDKSLTEEALFLYNWGHPEKWNQLQISLNKDRLFSHLTNRDRTLFPKPIHAPSTLALLLNAIPPTLLHQMCPQIRFLHLLYQFTTKLLANAAIIPQLFQAPKKQIAIRWIPALFDPQVQALLTQISSLCPPDLVVCEKNTFSSQDQVLFAISTLVSGLQYQNYPSSIAKQIQSPLSQMFFAAVPMTCATFATQELPASIQQWLANLHTTTKTHKLYLQITEKSLGFEIAPLVLREEDAAPIDLGLALKSSSPDLTVAILLDLSLLTQFLPNLDSFLNQGTPMLFPLRDFTSLFFQVIPAIRAVGIIVLLPKSLRSLLRPKLDLKMETKEGVDPSSDSASFLGLKDLLTFQWQIAIGDHRLSFEEFQSLLDKSESVVKIRDEYVFLDDKEMAKLLKQIDKLPKELSQEKLLQALLAQDLDGASVSLDQGLKLLLEKREKSAPAALPGNLIATLRPYQERGFQWLTQNLHTGFGSILADDMGLGKTLQVITTLLALKNSDALSPSHKALIVAPTSLLNNWKKELEKFAPTLSFQIYHGAKRDLTEEADLLITSYGLVRRDLASFSKVSWLALVLDEAQNIKNPLSDQTKAIKSLKAQYKIAMSGTPVENRLSEYWSLFDFTNPAYLGSLKHFKENYSSPSERDRDQESLERFKKITNPFILRRLKSDKSIIADLPEKIETNRYCSLTPQQAAIYQEVVDYSLKKLESIAGIERKGLIFSLINSLKQICNHPSQFRKIEQDPLPEESGKFLALEGIVEELLDLGEKCLIFTQYVETGNLLVNLLSQRFQVSVPFLHGGLSLKERATLVEDFQNSNAIKIFIISIKAGGTGLNLTAATHVIHYDLWWNPAVENQATDRAYRIGQKKNVVVHRLITSGTFEEKIEDMLQSKKAIADLAINSGEKWISEMTTDQLKDLISLQKEI